MKTAVSFIVNSLLFYYLVSRLAFLNKVEHAVDGRPESPDFVVPPTPVQGVLGAARRPRVGPTILCRVANYRLSQQQQSNTKPAAPCWSAPAYGGLLAD